MLAEFAEFAAIHLQAQVIVSNSDDNKGIHASAMAIDKGAAQLHEGIRNMIHQLRPSLLDQVGLEDTLKELVAQWQQNNPDVNCELIIECDISALGEILDIIVYRIIQESLNNVTKHAQASMVIIKIRRSPETVSSPDSLLLSIEDDGKGINTTSAFNDGIGLPGMRERVLAAGGEFDLNNSTEGGLHIDISLPVNLEKEQKVGV